VVVLILQPQNLQILSSISILKLYPKAQLSAFSFQLSAFSFQPSTFSLQPLASNAATGVVYFNGNLHPGSAGVTTLEIIGFSTI
jgi:hypothetical protein